MFSIKIARPSPSICVIIKESINLENTWYIDFLLSCDYTETVVIQKYDFDGYVF